MSKLIHININATLQVLREVKLEKCADTIVGGTDPIYMKKVRACLGAWNNLRDDPRGRETSLHTIDAPACPPHTSLTNPPTTKTLPRASPAASASGSPSPQSCCWPRSSSSSTSPAPVRFGDWPFGCVWCFGGVGWGTAPWDDSSLLIDRSTARLIQNGTLAHIRTHTPRMQAWTR